MACCDVFQNAVNAVEHGLSLWLPRLRNYNRPTASAEDSAEVCKCSWQFIYVMFYVVSLLCIGYMHELTIFCMSCKISHLFSLLL